MTKEYTAQHRYRYADCCLTCLHCERVGQLSGNHNGHWCRKAHAYIGPKRICDQFEKR